MNTVNSSLLESLDLAKLFKEVDIGKLLSLIGKEGDISKLLPIIKGLDLDVLDLNGLDLGDLIPIIGEKIDIDELLSIFSPGETVLPIDNPIDIDQTFSFILPEETVQLLDGLLLEVLPVETLAKIDEAIEIDRLFSITLPTEVFSVVNDSIKHNEAVDIDALLSIILPDEAFPPVHENSKDHNHGQHDDHKHHKDDHKHHKDDHKHHHDDDHETGDNDQTFSFILPEETVQLLDGLLLEILPVETLAKIDEAIEIDKLFSITLPTETFSVVSDAIVTNELVDIDTLLPTVLPDEAFSPAHKNNKHHKDDHKHHKDDHKHHHDDDNETGDNDQTFSFILPEETVQLLDGLLLEILPVETLAKIDEAINIDKLFSITLPTEAFSVVSDAIITNEAVDIDELVSTIFQGNENENETFSFIIPEETLEITDGLLFEILPLETLAQIDSAIEVERLFSIELPIETFQLVNDAIINNEGIDADIQNILATILPDEASILGFEADISIDQSLLIPEASLI